MLKDFLDQNEVDALLRGISGPDSDFDQLDTWVDAAGDRYFYISIDSGSESGGSIVEWLQTQDCIFTDRVTFDQRAVISESVFIALKLKFD